MATMDEVKIATLSCSLYVQARRDLAAHLGRRLGDGRSLRAREECGSRRADGSTKTVRPSFTLAISLPPRAGIVTAVMTTSPNLPPASRRAAMAPAQPLPPLFCPAARPEPLGLPPSRFTVPWSAASTRQSLPEPAQARCHRARPRQSSRGNPWGQRCSFGSC